MIGTVHLCSGLLGGWGRATVDSVIGLSQTACAVPVAAGAEFGVHKIVEHAPSAVPAAPHRRKLPFRSAPQHLQKQFGAATASHSAEPVRRQQLEALQQLRVRQVAAVGEKACRDRVY